MGRGGSGMAVDLAYRPSSAVHRRAVARGPNEAVIPAHRPSSIVRRASSCRGAVDGAWRLFLRIDHRPPTIVKGQPTTNNQPPTTAPSKPHPQSANRLEAPLHEVQIGAVFHGFDHVIGVPRVNEGPEVMRDAVISAKDQRRPVADGAEDAPEAAQASPVDAHVEAEAIGCVDKQPKVLLAQRPCTVVAPEVEPQLESLEDHEPEIGQEVGTAPCLDRKSTRLNSSHVAS